MSPPATPVVCRPLVMQPIVTSLPASIPTSNPLSPDSTPFDSSPHSPTSATTTSDLSFSHYANRPAGQHNIRGVQAVVAEERLYQWRDTPTTAGEATQAAVQRAEAADGRVKGVGVGSTLWQRRQQQVNRPQQQSPQQRVDGDSTG